MLADIDSSIRAWLAAELSPGTEIGFDPPGLLAGIQRRPRRAGIVNVFLYAVNENLDGVPAARMHVRNADGRVTGTLAPTRSYHLSYLVTAWAADTAEEHELLGAVIGAHAEQDVLSPDYLRGSLHNLDMSLPVRVGWSPVYRGQDLWGALGVSMRTALDLTVTAPALPSRLKQAAPPVQTVDLDVYDGVPVPPEKPRKRWERTAIAEHHTSEPRT
ncbi:Pvc16 family protein [Actinokineospora sp.]|uniref:Pvc16 family protein n=1 Tax=Actinokineospora sp. TaxID=1872133 RepID=UPI0040379A68